MKKLPTAIVSFPVLIADGSAYVDKTELIYELAHRLGKAYFLSRPRRFGKSLLISTFASLFRAERDCFKGLWIDSSTYDWKPYPVIVLDLSGLNCHSPEALQQDLAEQIFDVAQDMGVSLAFHPAPSTLLRRLVQALGKEVVLLVDEYDSPLIANLCDSELTQKNQVILQQLYTTIKKLQSRLRFTFITGISRLTKMSLFSGLNNLEDISFDRQFATLTGLTQEELLRYFSEHIDRLGPREKILEEMRFWYNGYAFAADAPRVFNPWSVLHYLKTGEAENYWCYSGTPTFAIDLIKKRKWSLMKLEDEIAAGNAIKSSQDSRKIDLVTLLFQVGYLTISKKVGQHYLLCVPNEEVRRSLFTGLFESYTDKTEGDLWVTLCQLEEALEKSDFESFFASFNNLLSSIPYLMHLPNEAYYHTVLYLILKLLSFQVDAELLTGQGRIDLVVKLRDRVIILECKIDGSAVNALKQIRTMRYFAPYLESKKEILLVGVNFSSKQRAATDWQVEDLEGKLLQRNQTTDEEKQAALEEVAFDERG